VKLYVYGKCSICLGTNRTWYDRHCPYCNNDAKQFFEASDKTIITHILENFTNVDQRELITLLEQKLSKGEEDEKI
jgi:predicted DCC family thiol-disulfide oxidoreductase YuxK